MEHLSITKLFQYMNKQSLNLEMKLDLAGAQKKKRLIPAKMDVSLVFLRF